MGCLGTVPGYLNCLALFYSLVELINTCRPVGSGGSRGSARTPFWPPKDFIYCPFLSALPFENWSTSFAAIENHHRPNECGAAM